MSDKNWFRNEIWNEEIEKYFFSKLRRVRSKDMQAQYLLLQAELLAYKNDKNLMQVAKTLLSKLLTDYPDNKGDKSQLFNILGNICKFNNEYQKAIDYYKRAIDFEAIFPYGISNSFIDYSELVVKTKQTHLYNDVEKIFSEERYSNFTMFPHTNYKKYSILSIISKHKGDTEMAKYYADLADYNTNLSHSDFAKHQSIGLVKERDKMLDELVNGKII